MNNNLKSFDDIIEEVSNISDQSKFSSNSSDLKCKRLSREDYVKRSVANSINSKAYAATNHLIDRNTLLAQILNNLEQDLLSWQSGKDLTSKYRELSATIGKRVRVEMPDGSQIEGTAVDIDETGSLRLDDDQLITVGDVVHLDSKLSQ